MAKNNTLSNEPKHTILVVDDEYMVLDILSQTLEAEGYNVLAAGNGREALERLDGVRTDLVITDIMMPIVDGVQMCHTLQTDPRYKPYNSVPVVLMSAASALTIRGRCKYQAFIGKPFDLDNLLAVVTSLLP